MSTFTTSKRLEQVANGADVGVWDVPENSNWAVVDAALGQNTAISLNNTPVVLNAAQFQCNLISFNSTLTGNVSITFPTSFIGPYTILNACTGSSAFVITLVTTAASNQIIACPFGETFDVYNNGTSLSFRGLDHIGSYWDYAGSAVPLWVNACTVPPYLNCTGGTFSSSTYPILATIFGGTTLPDSRSRPRIAMAQGATAVTSAVSGVPVNTLFGLGGDQNVGSHNHTATSSVNDPGHFHSVTGFSLVASIPGGGASLYPNTTTNTGTAVTNISVGVTVNSGGTGAAANMPPVYVGGITMIRAG